MPSIGPARVSICSNRSRSAARSEGPASENGRPWSPATSARHAIRWGRTPACSSRRWASSGPTSRRASAWRTPARRSCAAIAGPTLRIEVSGSPMEPAEPAPFDSRARAARGRATRSRPDGGRAGAPAASRRFFPAPCDLGDPLTSETFDDGTGPIAGEAGRRAGVKVLMSDAIEKAVSLDFETVGVSAVADEDLRAVPGAPVIGTGQTEATIEIPILGDGEPRDGGTSVA